MTTAGKSTMRRDLSLMIGIPLALIIALFAYGAQDGMFDGMSDLIALSRALATEFHEPGAGINVTDKGVMTLNLVGAGFAGLDSTAGAQRAKAIAKYAAANWHGSPPITSVAIKITSTTGVPGLTVTRSETPYVFTVAELAAVTP